TKTIDGATEENYSGVASFQAGSDVLIEFDYTNDKALEAPAENGTGDSEGLGEDNSDTIDNGEKTNSNDMGSSSAGVRQESMTSPDLAQDTYDEPALAEEEVDYVNPFAGIADEVADTEKNDGEISQGPVEIYIEKLDGYFIAEYDNENQYYEVFDDAGVAIGYTGSIEGPISITYFDTENAEKENPSTFDLNIMLPPLLAMCVAVYGLIKVRRGIFSR
ncbi:MAG: hypothetical protein LBV08_01500, partial [Clostridiales bacterium]|nr:hypothetical protein [Clostridiales bacterium]